MLSQEQLAEMVMINGKDIAALKESTKSAHHRIDSNDEITAGIHKVASNVEALTLQVKHLTERMNESLLSVEARLKSQGERIGTLESKPGKKWETVAEKVLLLVVGSVVAFVMTKIGL